MRTFRNIEATRGAVIGILIAYASIAFAFGWLINIQHRQSHTAAENRRALAYICSSSEVLDGLVVAAGNEIRKNFQNGTYAELERVGILRQSSLLASGKALVAYDRAHVKLSNDSPCLSVIKK